MNNVIATLGIAHSGTNLLKKIFIDLFSRDKKYTYRYLGHNKSKDGKLYLDVGALNIPRLHVGIFNYRNEFDRRLSYVIRSITGGLKGWPPTGTNIDLDSYSDQIVNKVLGLLNDTEEMRKTKGRCDEVLAAKRAFIQKCKQHKANFVCLPYESFYENFDYIFDSLSKFGVVVPSNEREFLKKKYSVENMFKISRSEESAAAIHKKHNLLSNHVSHTKGEPYFWTKLMDFDDVFNSLPQESQDCFRYIVAEHPHANLPFKL